MARRYEWRDTGWMGAIDDLLAAIESGKGADVADLYTEDALLDATVPGWRFTVHGGTAIAAQYSTWFADAGKFGELDRRLAGDGELVTYFLTWEEDGVAHGAHHSHLLCLDSSSGRIASDKVFCGGRWPASLMEEMAAAERA